MLFPLGNQNLLSAWGPRHIAAAENVEMQVGDGLSALHAAVVDDPVAVRKLERCDEFCDDLKDV